MPSSIARYSRLRRSSRLAEVSFWLQRPGRAHRLRHAAPRQGVPLARAQRRPRVLGLSRQERKKGDCRVDLADDRRELHRIGLAISFPRTKKQEPVEAYLEEHDRILGTAARVQAAAFG